MKFSLTDSLLQRNDTLIKEIVRLRKKNNKLIQELKTQGRKAIRITDTVSVGTQTSPDVRVHHLPRSPISLEKIGRKKTPTTTPISARETRRLSHKESQVTPTQSFSERSITPPSNRRSSYQLLPTPPDVKTHLSFDHVNDKRQIINIDDTLHTPDISNFPRRLSRRSSVRTPVSYKEPSLKKKIRKGHQYFEAK